MFKLGALLGDVIAGLRKPPDAPGLIEQLKHNFDNLREVLGPAGAESCALVEPVAARFQETLHAVAATRPDLADRVERLATEVERLLGGAM